jgi:hypothetical protein
MLHHIEAHHLANPQPWIGNLILSPNIKNLHVAPMWQFGHIHPFE